MPKLRNYLFILFQNIKNIFPLFYLHIKLRIHGVVYGNHLRGNGCQIKNKGKIELGDNVWLFSYSRGQLYKSGLFAYLDSSLIKIGNNTWLNGAVIQSRNKIIIGDNCIFGPGVIILDNDSHNTSIDPKIRRYGKINDNPVIIGNNVWRPNTKMKI